MDIEEIVESPAFWLLGIGGTIATMIGYIWSRNQGWEVLPFWQLIIIIITILVASAFFGTRD